MFFFFLRVKECFYHRIKCSVTPGVIASIHHRAKEDTLLSLSFAGLFFFSFLFLNNIKFALAWMGKKDGIYRERGLN